MVKKFSFKIRPMTESDLKQVIEIEKLCFEQPYSKEILEQELKISAAKIRVAAWRRKIVGYIDFWVVKDEVELVSIAVHPKYKRLGIGNALMVHLIEYCEDHEVRFIYLDVRTSNSAAQALYQQFGFQRVGLRRAYYSDNGEDAIIMKKELM